MMLRSITQALTNLIRSHGPLAVFLWGILKSVIPIPTPSLMMVAGTVLVAPHASALSAAFRVLALIAIPGAAGVTIGAHLFFGLAYWGGRPIFERYGRVMGFPKNSIQHFERRILKDTGPVLFAMRALPFVPISLGSLLAGFLRLPALEFAFWTFLGAVPRCFMLGYCGYLMSETYIALEHRMAATMIFSCVITLAGTGALILWAVRQNRRLA